MSVNIYNSNPNATSEEENFSRVADRGSKLASDTIYSNTTSGLNSVNVQGAIDEVNEKVDDNVEAISQINSDLTDIIRVETIYKQGVTITANAETLVDFTSEITNTTPNGYKFIGMSFCGAYPCSTWHGVSVTPCAGSSTDKSIKFTTTQTQGYNLCMAGIFIRNI